MADVISGLESDLEEAKSVMRSSSNAHASAAKALVRLRTGRDSYIILIDHAKKDDGTPFPKVGDETASDLLSPFLLLLSHKDVPSVGACASLSGVQRLVQSGLLNNADAENVCHTLETLLLRRENSIDFKIMQTCAVIARAKRMFTIDVYRRVVSATSIIASEDHTKDLSVRKTAIGCLIQISSSIFERAASPPFSKDSMECARALFEELCSVPERNDTSSAARTGIGLIRSMALFATGGKPAAPSSDAVPASSRAQSTRPTGLAAPHTFSSADAIWIEANNIFNKDAVEIMDSILTDNAALFATSPELAALVKEKAGPTILNLLRGKYRESASSGGYGWPLLVRLMRAIKSLFVLRDVCGPMLTLNLYGELVAMLETENNDVIVTPPWHYILTLETLLAAFQCTGFLPFLFSSSLPLTARTVEGLSKLVQTWSSPPQDWAEIDSVAREAELSSRGDVQARRARSRGLDLLTDAEPPVSFAGPMIVLVATECIVAALADGALKDTPTIRVGGLLRRVSSTSPTPDDEESLINEELRKSILEVTWKPCLTTFSCLLAGCQEEGMVQYVMRAYLSLTTSCGAAKLVEARDAFISSMCKYALPDYFTSHSSALTMFDSSKGNASRGDPSQPTSASQTSLQAAGASQYERLLTHKHLQILKTLFNVAHGLGSMLGTSWHIVLETFEQLDLVLHVQHAQMTLAHRRAATTTPDAESEDAQSLSQQMEELGEEEMDAETKMIESMLKNLFETSKYLDNDAVLHMVIALSQMIFTNLAHATTSSTASAIASPAGSGASSTPTKPFSSSGPRRLLENLTQGIKTALIQTAGSPSLQGTSHQQQLTSLLESDDLRFPPFALDKLVETAELNMERIGQIWEVVGSTLLTVASSDNDSKLRAFAVKAMEKLVTKVVTTHDDTVLRRDVVRKFTELARSPQNDTKDYTLVALYRFVSSAGHRLEGLWNLIVAELLIISTTLQSNKQTSANAFKVVQLIMDDYRPSLDMGCLPSLALCLRAFGEQQNDVNMALTSVHHLWLLCEKGDESLEFLPDHPNQPTRESLLKANALWLHVFDQLRTLSLDPRMEVRNSALRSLCTNVVACGDRLTVQSWRTCALDIMLQLIDAVDAKAFSANASQHVLGERLSSHTDARMTLHHSQDTEEKQWRETRVTAMQGTGKIVASIMQKVELYQKLEWFPELWERTLACVERALNSNSPARDVVSAAASVLEELALLVCGAKSRLKYAVPGMRVVNGALVRTVASTSPPPTVEEETDEPNSKKSKNSSHSIHLWLWPSLHNVFDRLGARHPPPFDQDIAALLVNIYAELLESKDCMVIRQPESLLVVLKSCESWTRHFAKLKNSTKFVSPLERNVLKTYSRIAPLEDDETWVKIVFTELRKLMSDEEKDGEDDFHNKAHLVYADLFSQAPDSVKAGCLREALLTNSTLSFQVVHLGLDSLPDSGLLDDAREDVWIQVLDKAGHDRTAMDVLMKEGVSMLRRQKVPLAVKDGLLKRIEGETISPSTSFEMKVEMLNTMMNAVAIGGGSDKLLAKDLFPSFLTCSKDVLETHHDHAMFGALLMRMVELEMDPEIVVSSVDELTLHVAKARRCRKPHLIHLVHQLELVAVHAQDVTVRAISSKAMSALIVEGWKA